MSQQNNDDDDDNKSNKGNEVTTVFFATLIGAGFITMFVGFVQFMKQILNPNNDKLFWDNMFTRLTLFIGGYALFLLSFSTFTALCAAINKDYTVFSDPVDKSLLSLSFFTIIFTLCVLFYDQLKEIPFRDYYNQYLNPTSMRNRLRTLQGNFNRRRQRNINSLNLNNLQYVSL